MIVKNMFSFVAVIICSVFLVACGGSDGSAGAAGSTGSDGLISIVNTTSLLVGDSNCANGGIQVDHGIDADISGQLDDTEISGTEYICNGADGGASPIINTVSTSADFACPNGGVATQIGADINTNSILDANEVTSFIITCNGFSTTPTAPVFVLVSDTIYATTGGEVTLDASGSYDANGDTLYFKWSTITEPLGSSAAISVGGPSSTTFAPDIDGVYTLDVKIYDSLTEFTGGLPNFTNTITVYAASGPTSPVADAGKSLIVKPAQTVRLDGSSSYDLNGEAITYSWTVADAPGGSASTLSDTTSATPDFTSDLEGLYTFELVVNDGTSDSAVSTVYHYVAASYGTTYTTADTAQDINGGDFIFAASQTISVTGAPTGIAYMSVTLDIAEDDLSDISAHIMSPMAEMLQVWTSGFNGTQMTGTTIDYYAANDPADDVAPYANTSYNANGSSRLLEFNGVYDPNGTWYLNVFDWTDSTSGEVEGSLNSWSITISDTLPFPIKPVSEIVFDSTAKRFVGDTVNLDGSDSSDLNGDSLTYSWTIQNAPAASVAAISDATAMAPTFTPDEPGLYKIGLVVNDAAFDSEMVIVEFNILSLTPTLQITSSDTPVVISEGSTSSSTITIPGTHSISHISFTLNVTYADIGDITLVVGEDMFFGPTCTFVAVGMNTGANLTDTVFEERGTNSLSEGTAPYTATFIPDGECTFSDFEEAQVGTLPLYYLEISDYVMDATPSGTLDSWTVNIW